MTNITKERVEELKGIVELSWSRGRTDLLSILDDYSALKAENERLKKATVELGIPAAENLSQAEKAEAQLEKQRPLVEEAMCLSEADAEMGEVGGLVRAALKLREEGK